MRRTVLALIGWFGILQILPAQVPAQVYKYVDKNGVTHYTNVPTDKKYIKHKSIGVKDPKKKGRYAIKKSSKQKKAADQKETAVPPDRK